MILIGQKTFSPLDPLFALSFCGVIAKCRLTKTFLVLPDLPLLPHLHSVPVSFSFRLKQRPERVLSAAPAGEAAPAWATFWEHS